VRKILDTTRQLDVVAAAVGDQAFSAVIGLLVHGRPVMRIAGDCGLDARHPDKAIASALLAVARAYDSGRSV